MRFCHKKMVSLLLGGAGLLLLTAPRAEQQVMFSAMLTNGSCEVSLNKQTLNLGTVSQQDLRPESVLNLKPLTLRLHNCSTTPGSVTGKPKIRVSGYGVTQDGKWLFRSVASQAAGTGVLLFHSNSEPGYAQTEVRDGEEIVLRMPLPSSTEMTFYAGLSCGARPGCATAGVGRVNAAVTFTFEYD